MAATALAHNVLSGHNIKVENHEVTVSFNNAIEVYLYRIASLLTAIALLHGSRRISKKHLEIMRSMRKPHHEQSGGAVMASEFYGQSQPAIWTGALDTNTTTIDFDAGTARPAIDMTGGATGGAIGAGAHHAMIAKQLRANIEAQNCKISSVLTQELMVSVVHDIHGLVAKLGSKKPVTEKKLQSVLASKQFAMFA
jgi:hypothetical protein